ncbi:hypothetical protein M0802_006232 [Mischocyttarus mexicanus]|nr:hypothetical protein M0802_006232 [Mischocyttarus mexicanus]
MLSLSGNEYELSWKCIVNVNPEGTTRKEGGLVDIRVTVVIVGWKGWGREEEYDEEEEEEEEEEGSVVLPFSQEPGLLSLLLLEGINGQA